MKKFINNELNEKIIKNNIKSNTLPPFILLTGVYGTGKTDFAIEIARSLVCTNNEVNGSYCGECEVCRSTEDISNAKFDKKVSLFDMTSIEHSEFRTLIKESHKVLTASKKVIILDEMQALNISMQEELLSDFRFFKDVHLIFTTSNKSKIEKGLVSRSVELKMGYLDLKQTEELIRQQRITLDKSVIESIYDKTLGTPRDIIKIAKVVTNGDLTVEEAIEYIDNNNKEFSFKELFDNFHDRQYVIQQCIWLRQNMSKTEIDQEALRFLNIINQDKKMEIYLPQHIIEKIILGGDNIVSGILEVLDSFNKNTKVNENNLKAVNIKQKNVKTSSIFNEKKDAYERWD